MKHKSLIFVPLVLVLLLSVSAVAAVQNPVTPSTNDINITKGWAHFDVLSKGDGTATLNFIAPRAFLSCFEYRTDGDTSQKISASNYNAFITDGLYPNYCQNNNSSVHTITADQYIEIRMVFGAETDERFDWTRIYIGQCYIDAPASVNEGASFTATVSCDGVDGVYGFQFGTSVSGDASTSATSYTKGSFVTAVDPNFITGSNTLSNYSVTRSIPAAAAANSPFTLGSVDYTAAFHLTAPGEATLTLDPLLLGDITGADLSATFASTTKVIINDLLTLDLTVNSDGSITKVRDVTATVDGTSQGPVTPNPAAIAATLHFTDVIGTSTPTLTADMRSHLACGGGTVSLPLSVNSGALTLKAGDVNNDNKIDLLDSGAIGWALGKSAATYPDVDVNGDGEINVFDLIHVGRNYNATTEPCELS